MQTQSIVANSNQSIMKRFIKVRSKWLNLHWCRRGRNMLKIYRVGWVVSFCLVNHFTVSRGDMDNIYFYASYIHFSNSVPSRLKVTWSLTSFPDRISILVYEPIWALFRIEDTKRHHNHHHKIRLKIEYSTFWPVGKEK